MLRPRAGLPVPPSADERSSPERGEPNEARRAVFFHLLC